ncbi:MAG: iron-only hydrogenase system regulator [Clostridia bacterium]|nr:iron-only hydrogenase system regulator [Clostridia bacterium]
MDNKIASLSIIVNDYSAVEKVNLLLHDYRDYILGRLGIPVKNRGISVIDIVLDAPQEILNALSGKLGMINGVKSKVLFN